MKLTTYGARRSKNALSAKSCQVSSASRMARNSTGQLFLEITDASSGSLIEWHVFAESYDQLLA